MQVGFWSTVHGQTATTSNTLVISLMCALEYRLKILVTHNHYARSTLETSLLNQTFLKTELMDLKDTGIDALSRFIKFNKVDKESISSYTTTILRNRLDLLMGTSNPSKELYMSDLNAVMETILTTAKDCYDLQFVDIASGDNALSNKILLSSDLIVVNINQNSFILEDFFANHKEKFKNCMYLVGLYDKESRLNIKNIIRKYKINKSDIAVIPYCREFADACNGGKAVDFFLKNLNASKEDSHYEFIMQGRKAVDILLNKLSIDTDLQKSGE
jgi:hypothetical protein